MRALSTTLLSSLALPVVAVHGFQTNAFAMPPHTNSLSPVREPIATTATIRKRPNAANSASAPLHYTDDANAVAVDATQRQQQSTQQKIISKIPNGGAIQYATKAIPILALATAVAAALTRFLSNFSSPAAQGIKLVYAGAIAGIISRTCCAPIEMVSTVMMCRGDAVTSMWTELAQTWKREGLKGMFKGNGANCLKVAPSRGTQFLVYEFVKRKMVAAGIGMAVGSASLHAGARLFAGGIAGMIAAAIVYPLEVVKTMLTLYPNKCQSITSALKFVYRSSGVGGLYRGLGPTLIAMFPYVGVEFMVYETLKRRWEMHVGPVGTVALLLLGATGGAAAQASAHPLDVIRRRMQMQNMNEAKRDDDVDGGEDAEAKKYSNMFTGLYHVGKTEGVHVLFNGLGPACLEKIPSTAIGYFIYEFLKVTLKVSSV